MSRVGNDIGLFKLINIKFTSKTSFWPKIMEWPTQKNHFRSPVRIGLDWTPSKWPFHGLLINGANPGMILQVTWLPSASLWTFLGWRVYVTRIQWLLVTNPTFGDKVRSRPGLNYLDLEIHEHQKKTPPKTSMTMEKKPGTTTIFSRCISYMFPLSCWLSGDGFNSTHCFGQQTLPLTYMIHLSFPVFLGMTGPRRKTLEMVVRKKHLCYPLRLYLLPSGTKPYTWMSQDVSKNGL